MIRSQVDCSDIGNQKMGVNDPETILRVARAVLVAPNLLPFKKGSLIGF